MAEIRDDRPIYFQVGPKTLYSVVVAPLSPRYAVSTARMHVTATQHSVLFLRV